MFLLLSLGEDLASDRAKNQWRTEGRRAAALPKGGAELAKEDVKFSEDFCVNGF